MGTALSRRIIKLLCGDEAYARGEDAYIASQVKLTYIDSDSGLYEARVGANECRVQLKIDRNGDVLATCSCKGQHMIRPYCEHIAAALLHVHEGGKEDDGEPRVYPSLLWTEGSSSPGFRMEEEGLADVVLELFGKPFKATGAGTRFDSRQILALSFIVSVLYSRGIPMLGIELAVESGKRWVPVPRIGEFLDAVKEAQACPISKILCYEPKRHRFEAAEDRVVQHLIGIREQERMIVAASTSAGAGGGRKIGSSTAQQRALLLPPAAWESVLPLLGATGNARIEGGVQATGGIRIEDEVMPLTFAFSESQDNGYVLTVNGLADLTILEAYGLAYTEGRLLGLEASRASTLAELKRVTRDGVRNTITISADRVESYVDRVIPGLMKLGEVHIAESVQKRMVRTPLKAKLYLDRVKDRLLAGLEFHYGDIIIQPLEEDRNQRGGAGILVREGEKERTIIALIEGSNFTPTGGGYVLAEEEAEFDFLYQVIPELEKLVDIYATSAVKERIQLGSAPPLVRVEMDERTDWLEIKFEMEGVRDKEMKELIRSIAEKRKYYRLPHGALVPLGGEAYREIADLIRTMGLANRDRIEATTRVPAVMGLYLPNGEGGRGAGGVQLSRSLRQMLEHLRNPDHLAFPLPESLESVLRDYQAYGYQWMKTLARYGFGGILADDMGLGKTLQSISFLLSELPEIRRSGLPALVVAPSSLLYNWRNELKRFAPAMKVVIADGEAKERAAILRNLTDTDVLLTSYPLLRKDIARFRELSFHTLILDEAQTFKNEATQTARAVKRIQARNRFALTGTPIENRLGELWSIFDAVFPALFQSRKAFEELSREDVSRRIRPFLLRRLKRDVLRELPEKIETLQASELLPQQKKIYTAYLAKLRKDTLKHLHEEGFRRTRLRILAGLTRLRQICCHPALFVEGYEGSSAKFEQLLELVEECRSAGRRALLFSQFTGMLDLIKRELGNRGVPFFYLDGSTPSAERVERCNRFNEGERDLFLISLKAGGTGLNLPGADTVILYDLWWNPAVEQQAMDRAHRIGQKKVVQVIRLVAQGTVEDKMHEIQKRKVGLIEEILEPDEEASSALTEEDLRGLLSLNEA